MPSTRLGVSTSLALWVASSLVGCGESKDAPAVDAPGTSSEIQLVVRGVNYNPQAPQMFLPTPVATNTNNGAPDGRRSLGTLSGPPLGMRVYLQQISLNRSNAPSATIFMDTTSHTTDSGIVVTGCRLQLANGNVDLSACAGLDTLTVPSGIYTGTTVTFAEVAEIQGCLNAQFSSLTTSTPTVGTYTYPPPFPQTPTSYTTDAVVPNTTLTFCTRRDQHYFQAETASATAIGNNASYEPTDAYFASLAMPDYVAIDLLTNNPQAQTMAQLKAASTSITTMSAPSAGATQLTIAVDMNRMLQFFANVRSDFNPPGSPAHTGTSYFFTGGFAPVNNGTSAVTAYLGTVASVQGYQWTATATGGSTEGAAGWYTLYFDASGNYLGGTMYGDSINQLTIMQGNATVTSGAFTASGGATLQMDIAGTCAGFTTTVLNGTGTCTLTANAPAPNSTFNVVYTRLL